MINRLAEYEGADVSLRVTEYEKYQRVDIDLETYGQRELARAIWSRFTALHGDGSERTVDIATTRARLTHTEFLKRIELIAVRWNLAKTEVCPQAYMACYRSKNVEIRPWTRFTDDELAVMLVDTGWSTVADSVEADLRKALLEDEATQVP